MKKKVLIIEDGEAFRFIFREILESRGFEVLEASEGEQGLKLFLAAQPDLILLDLMLPGIDGFELLKQIRRDQIRKTPVVILTALEDNAVFKKAIELGATDCLVKGSFTSDEIAQKIQTLTNPENTF